MNKFLDEDNGSEFLKEQRQVLADKVLSQFPIFALNEDYMRAVMTVVLEKLERA